MLIVGLIQVRNCPYSSLVLLFKKKDKSWRFCVDYRAQNKVTLPVKYSILVINELIDELNGAWIFSKLGSKSSYHRIRVKGQR